MRVSTVALGIGLLIAGLSASIWSARYAPWCAPATGRGKRDRQTVAGNASGRGSPGRPAAGTGGSFRGRRGSSVDRRPPIAEQAPFPKAVFGDRVYRFGSMGIDEERKHVFRIENRGKAPLVLAKGPTECKCTLSRLSHHELAPGAATDIEIDWTPRKPDPIFEKTAILWTNDPAAPEIHFEVVGKVVPPLTVAPRAWHAGNVTEDQEGQVVGTVSSEVAESFEIVSVAPADPNLRVQYRPLRPGEAAKRKVRSGYEFTVTVARAIRLGRFRSLVRIVTSLPGTKPIDVEIAAWRSGPIRFLPAVPLAGSAYWNSEKSLLNMGRFSHHTGTKTALPAVVYAMQDKFQIVGVKSSDQFVKVSLEPNPQAETRDQDKQRQNVRFLFEVPPGSPAVNYLTGEPIHVTVKTNYPKLPELGFDLSFVSR